jgi:CBS domain-containing protein
MTKEPMTVTPEVTLAYALNLMSQGGFRHLPVVDDAGRPSGVLSVKDVIDLIVSQFVEDALALE